MHLKRLRKATFITIISLVFLILAGSIVRTTGSGLGCPDWPKCFGSLIPPTDVSQLPSDYQTRFAINGREIAEFSVLKTWIEYINRLLGVVVGIEMIWLVILAFPLRSHRPNLFRLSSALLLLTIFQGWIGAKVVSSHLAPHMITVHMVIAMIIILMAVALWIRTIGPQSKLTIRSSRLGWIILLLSFMQLVLGTEVREGVDAMTNAGVTDRAQWLNQDSMLFLIHRSFSLLILLATGFWLKNLWNEERQSQTRSLILFTGLCFTLAPISGVILAYFGMPAFAQPLHLVLAALILSAVFALIYRPEVQAP